MRIRLFGRHAAVKDWALSILAQIMHSLCCIFFVIVTVLCLAGSTVAQSDLTCVRYMEADHEFRKNMKVYLQKDHHSYLDDEVEHIIYDRKFSTRLCYFVRKAPNCHSFGMAVAMSELREAYNNVYKGPKSKIPEIMNKLISADRWRCRERGFK